MRAMQTPPILFPAALPRARRLCNALLGSIMLSCKRVTSLTLDAVKSLWGRLPRQAEARPGPAERSPRACRALTPGPAEPSPPACLPSAHPTLLSPLFPQRLFARLHQGAPETAAQSSTGSGRGARRRAWDSGMPVEAGLVGGGGRCPGKDAGARLRGQHWAGA